MKAGKNLLAQPILFTAIVAALLLSRLVFRKPRVVANSKQAA